MLLNWLEGCTVVVAVGGDGTISECANGYLLANAKEKGVAFAILPLGLKISPF